MRNDKEKNGIMEIMVFEKGEDCKRSFNLMIGKEKRLICI